jgi:hypothetical protein
MKNRFASKLRRLGRIFGLIPLNIEVLEDEGDEPPEGFHGLVLDLRPGLGETDDDETDPHVEIHRARP